jgi:hypothetical protein
MPNKDKSDWNEEKFFQCRCHEDAYLHLWFDKEDPKYGFNLHIVSEPFSNWASFKRLFKLNRWVWHDLCLTVNDAKEMRDALNKYIQLAE